MRPGEIARKPLPGPPRLRTTWGRRTPRRGRQAPVKRGGSRVKDVSRLRGPGRPGGRGHVVQVELIERERLERVRIPPPRSSTAPRTRSCRWIPPASTTSARNRSAPRSTTTSSWLRRAATRPSPRRPQSAAYDDPTTYTCTLEPGLKFSDGSALTSEDVAYSFKRNLEINDPQRRLQPPERDQQARRRRLRMEPRLDLDAERHHRHVPSERARRDVAVHPDHVQRRVHRAVRRLPRDEGAARRQGDRIGPLHARRSTPQASRWSWRRTRPGGATRRPTAA